MARGCVRDNQAQLKHAGPCDHLTNPGQIAAVHLRDFDEQFFLLLLLNNGSNAQSGQAFSKHFACATK
jgi:hypothetical protein